MIWLQLTMQIYQLRVGDGKSWGYHLVQVCSGWQSRQSCAFSELPLHNGYEL